MLIQAFTTIPPVWHGLIIRGKPTLLRCVLFPCLLSDLRLFPERYVVCVSCPEDASVHHGNPSLAAVSAVYTPLFPLPVAWQKVQHWSVCYYRVSLPNCALPLCIVVCFTTGQGVWTLLEHLVDLEKKIQRDLCKNVQGRLFWDQV